MYKPQIETKNTKRGYRRNASYYFYGEIRGTQEVFIKESKNSKGEERLSQEYYNQKFILRLAKKENLGFHFLPVYREENHLRYPDLIHAEWLGFFKNKKIILTHREYWDDFIHNFIRFQKALQKVKYKDLSAKIKKDAQDRADNYQKNLTTEGKRLLKNKIITQAFYNTAKESFDLYGHLKAYQHHDAVLWHTSVTKRQMCLVDAGWAGWSLKYFDLAYAMLQTVGFTNEVDFPKKLYQEFKKVFKKIDPDFDRVFLCAFYYWSIRILHDFKDKPVVQKRLKRFIKEII